MKLRKENPKKEIIHFESPFELQAKAKEIKALQEYSTQLVKTDRILQEEKKRKKDPTATIERLIQMGIQREIRLESLRRKVAFDKLVGTEGRGRVSAGPCY